MAGKITSKYTADQYRATVREIADAASGLPADRRESCVSDNIVGTVWPNQKGAILVALTSMNVNPGEHLTAADIKHVLDEDNARYYDGEALWAVLDLAVRVGMIEDTLREAAEIAKGLPPFVDCPRCAGGNEWRCRLNEDCHDGQTRYPEEDE